MTLNQIQIMLKKCNKQTIVIRKAENRDIESLVKLQKQIYQGCSPWNEPALKKELNKESNSLYLVLYQDSELVAFIGAKFYQKETHISNLLVALQYQKKHIGTDLLHFIIKLAKLKGNEYVSLEVSVNNKIARKMYRSLGFRKMFIRKNYYLDSTDAINMVRFLNE